MADFAGREASMVHSPLEREVGLPWGLEAPPSANGVRGFDSHRDLWSRTSQRKSARCLDLGCGGSITAPQSV